MIYYTEWCKNIDMLKILSPATHSCPLLPPIVPSQPFLVSHHPFLQHTPAPHQSHAPCFLPQPLQQSFPAFNKAFQKNKHNYFNDFIFSYF